MRETPTAPLAVIVLCYNEEQNLPDCLSSVSGWARELFVVDSGSTDRSREIATEYGAKVLEHPFETHAKQWNWAFEASTGDTEWILALDADHRITPDLREEISKVLNNPSAEISGYYIKRRQFFRGKWIRHGGYYPKYLLKLARRGSVWSDESELLDFRLYVSGQTAKMEHDLIEDNQKDSDIDFYLKKHIRFASLQAREELDRRIGNLSWKVRPSLFGTPDERILFIKRYWYRMPLYIRPFFYFGFRYFIQLGFLDGKQGFLFHFLQAFWYRLLVDVKLDQLRQARKV